MYELWVVRTPHSTRLFYNFANSKIFQKLLRVPSLVPSVKNSEISATKLLFATPGIYVTRISLRSHSSILHCMTTLLHPCSCRLMQAVEKLGVLHIRQCGRDHPRVPLLFRHSRLTTHHTAGPKTTKWVVFFKKSGSYISGSTLSKGNLPNPTKSTMSCIVVPPFIVRGSSDGHHHKYENSHGGRGDRHHHQNMRIGMGWWWPSPLPNMRIRMGGSDRHHHQIENWEDSKVASAGS